MCPGVTLVHVPWGFCQVWLQDQDPTPKGCRPLDYLSHQLLILYAVPLCPQTAISPLPRVHRQHFLWLLLRSAFASIQLPSWPSCLPSLSFDAWWSDRAVCPQFASEFLPLALQGRYFQKGGVKITQWHLKDGTERITWQHGQEHQTHQLWVVLGRERSTWSQDSDFLMMLEVGHVWTFTKNSEKLGILV